MMFADQVCQSDFLRKSASPHIDPLLGLVAASNKFVLDAHFSNAVDALVCDRQSFRRLVPGMRLPYRLCWFEYNPAAVPRIVERGKGHADPTDEALSVIDRIGILVEALS